LNTAIEWCSRAVPLQESVVTAHPSNAGAHALLMRLYFHLGDSYRRAGHLDQARRVLQEAVDLGEALTAMDPSAGLWKQRLHAAYYRRIQLHLQVRELEHAERISGKIIRLARELIAIDGETPVALERMAWAQKGAGRVLLEQGDAAAARPHLEAAVDGFRRLCDLKPDNPEMASHLAFAHDWLAKCYRRVRKPDAGLSHFQAAFEIRAALLRQQPNVAKRKSDLILSQTLVANWHFDRATREGDAVARELYGDAQLRLLAMREAGLLEGCAKYDGWFREIRNRLGVLRQRTAAPSKTAASPTSALYPF
jgi:tetratricopeptide (TPR) repeat protein